MAQLFVVVETHKIKDIDSDFLDAFSGIRAIRTTKDDADYALAEAAKKAATEYAQDNDCKTYTKQFNDRKLVLASKDPWNYFGEDDDSEPALADYAVVGELRVITVSDIGEIADWLG